MTDDDFLHALSTTLFLDDTLRKRVLADPLLNAVYIHGQRAGIAACLAELDEVRKVLKGEQ